MLFVLALLALPAAADTTFTPLRRAAMVHESATSRFLRVVFSAAGSQVRFMRR